MKINSFRWLSMALIGMSTSFMLMACQKDNGGGGGSSSVVSAGCGTGFANSQYGCIPTAGCNSGFGMYQNQCVVINNTGSCAFGAQVINNQCLPMQQNCGSGFLWTGSSCVFATTGQPFPQTFPQTFQQPFPVFPQPYPLYGGYYGYGQTSYMQPMPVGGFGSGGAGFGFSIRF